MGCPYCIEVHSNKARKAGAAEQELAETTLVAAALRAGRAVTHGTHTLRAGGVSGRQGTWPRRAPQEKSVGAVVLRE